MSIQFDVSGRESETDDEDTGRSIGLGSESLSFESSSKRFGSVTPKGVGRSTSLVGEEVICEVDGFDKVEVGKLSLSSFGMVGEDEHALVGVIDGELGVAFKTQSSLSI